jgi:hypothetical protein
VGLVGVRGQEEAMMMSSKSEGTGFGKSTRTFFLTVVLGYSRCFQPRPFMACSLKIRADVSLREDGWVEVFMGRWGRGL